MTAFFAATSALPSTSPLAFSGPRFDSFPQVATSPSPGTLLGQIRNSLPFLWNAELDLSSPSRAYLRRLRDLSVLPAELSPSDHFLLCLSAHHASSASFVPTDLEHAVRFRLWQEPAMPDCRRQMAEYVLESAQWDGSPVSNRSVTSPRSQEILTWNQGEWLGTAVGAYAANRVDAPELAAELAAQIVRELHREGELFEDLRSALDGLGALRASALIAHNLGSLNRAMDLWSLDADDPLRLACYRAGDQALPGLGDSLHQATLLHQAYMAGENHRHFALRSARPLRKSADFLLPIGPFFEDWGRTLGNHPELSPAEVVFVVSCLIDGWQREKKLTGYTRALAGIEATFPGGHDELVRLLPASTSRAMKTGPLRSLCSVPRARFEEQWNRNGLRRFTLL